MESNRNGNKIHEVSPYTLTEEQKRKVIEYAGCVEENPSLWQRFKEKLGL